MFLKRLVIPSILLSSSIVTTHSYAEELVIALGNFSPMFAQEGESALFKDIIDGVYRHLPHRQVSYQYMVPNARLVLELNQNIIDGASNIFSQEEINGCLTEPVFRFKDVAVTLKSKNHNITAIKDLNNKSIVTYQRAEYLLGQEFSQTIAKSKYYQEMPNPEDQAKLLSSALVDVSIGDKYIFLHSLKSWNKEDYDPNRVVFHEIFPSVYSRMGFNKQALCDEFDQALVHFKASGAYDKIYDDFLLKLGYQND